MKKRESRKDEINMKEKWTKNRGEWNAKMNERLKWIKYQDEWERKTEWKTLELLTNFNEKSSWKTNQSV